MANKQADYNKLQEKASSVFNRASITFQEAVENMLNGTLAENETSQLIVDALGENGSIAPILEALKGKSSVEELNMNLVTGTASVVSGLDSINQTLTDIKLGLIGEKLATGPMVETLFLCWQDLLSFIYGEKIDLTLFGTHADKAEKPDKSMFNTLNAVSINPKVVKAIEKVTSLVESTKEGLTLNNDKLIGNLKDLNTSIKDMSQFMSTALEGLNLPLDKISHYTGSQQVEALEFKDAVLEKLDELLKVLAAGPKKAKPSGAEDGAKRQLQWVGIDRARNQKSPVYVEISGMSEKVALKFKGEAGPATGAALSGSEFLTATADAIYKIIEALRKFRRKNYRSNLRYIDEFLFSFAQIARDPKNRLKPDEATEFTNYLNGIYQTFNLYNTLAKSSFKMLIKADKVELAVELLGLFLLDFYTALRPQENPELLSELKAAGGQFKETMKALKEAWKAAKEVINSMGSLMLIFKLNISERNIKAVMKLLQKFTSKEFQEHLKTLDTMQPTFTRSTKAIEQIGKIFKAAGDISKSSIFIVIGAPFTFIALKITKTIINKALKIAHLLSSVEGDFKDALAGVKAIGSMMRSIAIIGVMILVFGLIAPKMTTVIKGLGMVLGATYVMTSTIKTIQSKAGDPKLLKLTVVALLGLAAGMLLLTLAIIGISKLVSPESFVGLVFVAGATFALIYIAKYAQKLLSDIDTKKVFLQLLQITGSMVIVMLAVAAIGVLVASLWTQIIGGIIMFAAATFGLIYITHKLHQFLQKHNANNEFIDEVMIPIIKLAAAALVTIMIIAVTGMVALNLAEQIIAGIVSMAIVMSVLVLIMVGLKALIKAVGGYKEIIEPIKDIVKVAAFSLMAVVILAITGIATSALMPAILVGMLAMFAGMALIALSMRLLKNLMPRKKAKKIKTSIGNIVMLAVMCAIGVLIMWGLSKLFKFSDIPGLLVFTVAIGLLALQMWLVGKAIKSLKLKKLNKEILFLVATVVAMCFSMLLIKVLMSLMPDIIEVMLNFGIAALTFLGIMYLAGKAADKIKKSTPITIIMLAGAMVVIAISLWLGSLIAAKIDMGGMIILGLAVTAFALLLVGLSYMKNVKGGALALAVITGSIILASTGLLILAVASQKFTPMTFAAAGIMVAIVGIFAALAIGLGVPVVAAMALLGCVVLTALVVVVLLLATAMSVIVNTVRKLDKDTLEKAKLMKPVVKQAMSVLDAMPSGPKMIEKSISLALFSAALSAMAAAMGDIAKMVQEYASMTIPEYQGTKVVGYRKLEEKDFKSAATNIKKIITTVGGAIINTYESHPKMFLGGFNTPFEITVRSVQKLGKLISKIAKGVQDFASMKIPSKWGKDADGYVVATEYKELTQQHIDSARKNVASIIITLSEAIMTVYNSDPSMFDEGLFTSSPYSRTVKAVQKLGRLISKIAKGVLDFAAMRIPKKYGTDKDGYTLVTEYEILSTNQIMAAQDNVVSIITTLSNAIMLVYNQDPSMFDEGMFSSSAYSKTVKAVSKLGGLISSIARGVQKWAAMQVPAEYGKDKDGYTQVTKYELLTLDKIDSAKNNVVTIVTTLSDAILTVYKDNPEMFDGGNKSPYVKTVNAVSKLGKLISSIAKGVQSWANMKVPSGYQLDKDGVLQVTGYELLSQDQIDSARENVSAIILTLCSTLMDLYDQNPQFFDKPFLGDSPFNNILNSTSKMGKMITEIAKGVQHFAELKLPVYGLDKDGKAMIVSYEIMKPDAVVKAGENIKEIIVTVASAIIDVYDSKPEMFDAPFLGTSPFTKVMDACKQMGEMITEIAKGVQTFAELKLPVYGQDKEGKAIITSYQVMKEDDITKAGENIKNIIVTVALAIVDVYELKPEMFDAPFLGSSPFTKVMDACTLMGDMISEIAKGIQSFAELKLPIYGKDKDGLAVIVDYRLLESSEIDQAAQNISTIITTIALTLSDLYEKDEKGFFKDPFLGSSPFRKMMEATGEMGDMITGIGEGIQNFAELKLPIYGKDSDGLPVIVDYRQLEQEEITGAATNIATIITTIASTLANLYENDSKGFFKDPFLGSSPFRKMMETTTNMGDMIKGIGEGLQAWATLSMPVYGTDPQTGVAIIVDYQKLTKDDLKEAADNIAEIITTIAGTLADLYNNDPQGFFKDPFLGSSPFKKMMNTTTLLGDLIVNLGKGLQEMAKLLLPIYGQDKETGAAIIVDYQRMKSSDIEQAGDNIKTIVTKLAETLCDLYDKKGEYFQEGGFIFKKPSKFQKILTSVSALGGMVANLASGIQAFAELSMPVWGQNKNGELAIIDRKPLKRTDFVNASTNIDIVVTHLCDTFVKLYQKYPTYFQNKTVTRKGLLGLFSSTEEIPDSSPIALVIKSIGGVAGIVEAIATAITVFAEGTVPQYNNKGEIVGRIPINDTVVEACGKSIGIVITCIVESLVGVLDDPKTAKLFEETYETVQTKDGGWFGSDEYETITHPSPVQRVVTSIGGVAGIVGSIALAILTFAAGTVELFDPKTGKSKGSRNLTNSDYEKAAESIGNIVTTLVKALVDSTNMVYSGESLFGSSIISKIESVIGVTDKILKTTGTMAKQLGELAAGIFIYQVDGKDVVVSLTQDQYTAAATTAASVITTLVGAIADLASKSEYTAVFKEFGGMEVTTDGWFSLTSKTSSGGGAVGGVLLAASKVQRVVSSMASNLARLASGDFLMWNGQGYEVKHIELKQFEDAGTTAGTVITTLVEAVGKLAAGEYRDVFEELGGISVSGTGFGERYSYSKSGGAASGVLKAADRITAIVSNLSWRMARLASGDFYMWNGSEYEEKHIELEQFENAGTTAGKVITTLVKAVGELAVGEYSDVFDELGGISVSGTGFGERYSYSKSGGAASGVLKAADRITAIVSNLSWRMARLASGDFYMWNGQGYEEKHIELEQFKKAGTTAGTVITTLVKAVGDLASGEYHDVFDDLGGISVSGTGFGERYSYSKSGGAASGVLKAADRITAIVSNLSWRMARLASGDFYMWNGTDYEEKHIELSKFEDAATTAGKVITTLVKAVGDLASGEYQSVFNDFGGIKVQKTGGLFERYSYSSSGGAVLGVLKASDIASQVVSSMAQRLSRLAAGEFLLWNGSEYEKKNITLEEFEHAGEIAKTILTKMAEAMVSVANNPLYKKSFEEFADVNLEYVDGLLHITSRSTGGALAGVLKASDKGAEVVSNVARRLARFAVGDYLLWDGSKYEVKHIELIQFETAADTARTIITKLVGTIADLATDPQYTGAFDALGGGFSMDYSGIFPKFSYSSSSGPILGVIKATTKISDAVAHMASRLARFAAGDYLLWNGDKFEKVHIEKSEFITAGDTASEIISRLVGTVVKLATVPEYADAFDELAGGFSMDYSGIFPKFSYSASSGPILGVIKATSKVSDAVSHMASRLARFAAGDYLLWNGSKYEKVHIEKSSFIEAGNTAKDIIEGLVKAVVLLANTSEYRDSFNELAGGFSMDFSGIFPRISYTRASGPILGAIKAIDKLSDSVSHMGFRMARFAVGDYMLWNGSKYEKVHIEKAKFVEAGNTAAEVFTTLLTAVSDIATETKYAKAFSELGGVEIENSGSGLFGLFKWGNKTSTSSGSILGALKAIDRLIDIVSGMGTRLARFAKGEFIVSTGFLKHEKILVSQEDLVQAGNTAGSIITSLLSAVMKYAGEAKYKSALNELAEYDTGSSNKSLWDLIVYGPKKSNGGPIIGLIRAVGRITSVVSSIGYEMALLARGKFTTIVNGRKETFTVTLKELEYASNISGGLLTTLIDNVIKLSKARNVRVEEKVFEDVRRGIFNLLGLLQESAKRINQIKGEEVLTASLSAAAAFEPFLTLLITTIGQFQSFMTSIPVTKLISAKTPSGLSVFNSDAPGSLRWVFSSIQAALKAAQEAAMEINNSINFINYQSIGTQYEAFFQDMKDISEQLDIKKNIKFETNVLIRYRALLAQLDQLVPKNDINSGAKAAKGLIIEVNKIDMKRAASFTTLLRELNMLSRRLGGLDKFTNALSSTLAHTLNKLTQEIANSALIIDKADEILENRAKRINALIQQINTALAAPIQVTPVVTDSEGEQRPSAGSGSRPSTIGSSSTSPGTGYDDTSDDFGGGSPAYEAPSQQAQAPSTQSASAAETEILYQALSILKRLQSKILSDS